jgi:hypothetical protein
MKYLTAELPFARAGAKCFSFFRFGTYWNIKKIVPTAIGFVGITHNPNILAADSDFSPSYP